LPPLPCSTLFPYTTLFRSRLQFGDADGLKPFDQHPPLALVNRQWHQPALRLTEMGASVARGGARRLHVHLCGLGFAAFELIANRSEEHTSELQSPYDLVCR